MSMADKKAGPRSEVWPEAEEGKLGGSSHGEGKGADAQKEVLAKGLMVGVRDQELGRTCETVRSFILPRVRTLRSRRG